MTAIDSTMFESRHVSRHFEKRCRQSERQARKKQRQTQHPPPGPAQRKAAQREVNRRRSLIAKRLPKLSLAVHAASHLILAVRATTGLGADHSHFVPLLRQAKSRMSLRTALADAGYDSEANHRAARQGLGVCSLIPATTGHPGTPTGYYRRLMRRRLKKGGSGKKCFGQRWQAETVNSMLKRNMTSACRARSPTGREKDMLLRAVTHNLMILCNL